MWGAFGLCLLRKDKTCGEMLGLSDKGVEGSVYFSTFSERTGIVFCLPWERHDGDAFFFAAVMGSFVGGWIITFSASGAAGDGSCHGNISLFFT